MRFFNCLTLCFFSFFLSQESSGNSINRREVPNEDHSTLLVLSRTLDEAKTSGDDKELLHAHYNLGMQYRKLKNPKDATQHLLIVSTYQSDKSDSSAYSQIMDSYVRIAGIFRDHELFDRAQSFLERGLQIARNENDSSLITRFLAHQSYAFQMAEAYESAILVSEEQLKFHTSIDLKRLRVLNDLGFSYSWLDQKEEAIEYYSQLLREASIIGNDEYIATAKHSLADLAYRKGKVIAAFDLFSESIIQDKQAGRDYEMYQSLRDISKISTDSGNYHFAVKYLKLAERVLEPKDYSAHEYIYRLLHENYLAMGKFEEANKYNMLRLDVLSAFDGDKRDVKYITRQNEIRAIVDGYYLELENERIHARTHRILLAVIVFLSVMLFVVISYVLLRRHKFNRQLNHALETLNWNND